MSEAHLLDKLLCFGPRRNKIHFKSRRHLSAEHETSKNLNKVIILLGDVRDHIKHGEYKEAVDLLPKLKSKLSDEAQKEIIGDISKFHATTKKQFDDWLSDQLQTLKTALKEKEVKPKEFHDLRKFITHITALFSALYAKDPNSQLHNYFCFLLSLNTEMGDVNDELKELKTNDPVEIPKGIRKSLEELVENLRVVPT